MAGSDRCAVRKDRLDRRQFQPPIPDRLPAHGRMVRHISEDCAGDDGCHLCARIVRLRYGSAAVLSRIDPTRAARGPEAARGFRDQRNRSRGEEARSDSRGGAEADRKLRRLCRIGIAAVLSAARPAIACGQLRAVRRDHQHDPGARGVAYKAHPGIGWPRLQRHPRTRAASRERAAGRVPDPISRVRRRRRASARVGLAGVANVACKCEPGERAIRLEREVEDRSPRHRSGESARARPFIAGRGDLPQHLAGRTCVDHVSRERQADRGRAARRSTGARASRNAREPIASDPRRQTGAAGANCKALV